MKIIFIGSRYWLPAASPKIRAPTIESALEVKLGILRSLSLKISKASIIIKASKKAGNGILFLCAAKLIIKRVGIIS